MTLRIGRCSFLILLPYFLVAPWNGGWAEEQSQCLLCHTRAGKLIQITREIAKSRPAAVSPESEGEG